MLLISFSGGRTSAFMAKFLKERHPEKEMIFVFANTGKERPETLEFIKQCDDNWSLNVVWLEYRCVDGKSTFDIVNYETASREGEPFEQMIAKYGLPNLTRPHCTRELKQSTIRRYMRSLDLTNYYTAIGIRADEQHRINWKKAEKEKLIYPLISEIEVGKSFIRSWWESQSFDLQLKDYEGNCDACWKKSKRKLLTIARESPEKFDWWAEMERKYGNGYTFFRGNLSANDLLEASTRHFHTAVDEHEISKQQLSMFSDIDVEYSCICS